MKKDLLVTNQQGFQAEGELWLRIAAFLDLKSSNTRKTYTGVINEWCRFLRAEPGTAEAAQRISSASDLHALAYKKWLDGQPGQKPRYRSGGRNNESAGREISINVRRDEVRDGTQTTLANATYAKKFAALRRIYKMLIAARLGPAQNPFDSDRLPPPSAKSGQKRPTEMIDFQKVKEICSLPGTETAKDRRDSAVLAILFGAGLRRSEAVKLRLGDLRQTSKGTAFVRLRATKSRRDYDQALPEWAADAVKAVLADRLKDGAGDGDYLFVSYRGQAGKTATNHQFSDHGLYQVFKHYCRMAGAGNFVTPHSARATAITKLLTDGLSHREVQEFSRHSSVAMVEVYDKRRIGVDQNPGKGLKY